MDIGPKIAQIAALVGDPARANMLASLMDGRALTASELAYVAGVAPPTASGHLAKLTEAGLLALEKQGRHRYFRLASAQAACALEGLMIVAQDSPARYRPHWRGGDVLRNARTCYDHLAGRLAVGITDALVDRGHVVLSDDGGEVTRTGFAFFAKAGIAVGAPTWRRLFCRPCLDWSERRPHLAGALGAALCRHACGHGWVERIKDSRALTVTPLGATALQELFGVVLDDPAPAGRLEAEAQDDRQRSVLQ